MENQYPDDHQFDENGDRPKPSTSAKVVVLIILILLLVAGIIIPIKLVPNALSSLSSRIASYFSRTDGVELSVDPAETNPGEEFTLSWSGRRRTDGSYILRYECTNGITFETSVSRPYEMINCSTDYYFTPDSNKIGVIATNNTKTAADVPVSLSFLENGSASTSLLANATVRVAASESTTPTSTSTPRPAAPRPTPSTPTPSTPRPTATSDLRITVLSVGILDADGTFRPQTSVKPSSRAAVRFNIQNVGGADTGTWQFSAVLPTSDTRVYNKTGLESLEPGSGVIYTLGFDNLKASTNNIVTITVSGDTVTSNNTATVKIPTTGY